MKRSESEVWVRLYDDFYAWNTHCHTIKEAMEEYPCLRNRRKFEAWRQSLGYESRLDRILDRQLSERTIADIMWT